MELIQIALVAVCCFILGGATIWWAKSRKTTTRAEALKVAHALYVEAMKLPGAEDAKTLADAQLVVENLARQQLADAIAKAAGAAPGNS